MKKDSEPLAITTRNTTLQAENSFLLRRPAEPVYGREIHSDDLRMIVSDLLNVAGATTNLDDDPNKRTMLGLHAKQLGYDKNVFVFWSNYQPIKDRPKDYAAIFRVIINPQITHTSETTNNDGEACFSIDNVGSTAVPRPDSIKFGGLEVDLDKFQTNGILAVKQIEDEEISEPYIARIFQHEADHGRGIRFPAVATRLTRKGKPEERLPVDEEAQVREISHPLPYDEPRTIVIMRNLKVA